MFAGQLTEIDDPDEAIIRVINMFTEVLNRQLRIINASK